MMVPGRAPKIVSKTSARSSGSIALPDADPGSKFRSSKKGVLTAPGFNIDTLTEDFAHSSLNDWAKPVSYTHLTLPTILLV